VMRVVDLPKHSENVLKIISPAKRFKAYSAVLPVPPQRVLRIIPKAMV
jgi:hypothetical protein